MLLDYSLLGTCLSHSLKRMGCVAYHCLVYRLEWRCLVRGMLSIRPIPCHNTIKTSHGFRRFHTSGIFSMHEIGGLVVTGRLEF
jgi:hypothetical protein